MKTVAIIPARMASTRFPGKPLASILNMPMIGHCYFRAKMCKSLDEVYIATCDEEIREYGEGIGAKVIMTGSAHLGATDRTAEAIEKIEKKNGEKIKIVAMIQGDEPMFTPEIIDDSVEEIKGRKAFGILNIISPISEREFESPNVVKVVVGQDKNVLYFSRSAIPSRAKWKGPVPMLKQLGIILFRKKFLFEYNEMKPTPLEEIESCDMLRVLEKSYKIKAHVADFPTWAVDTPEDLKFVEEKMKNDPLVKKYVSK
jgi:3-deoxy-manno-octulosonate cytidylyltransferase (CMP-KDO synthetase)